MHQRITGLADVSGKPQIPWPRKFGTPPWAVARQLSGHPGRGRHPRDVLAGTWRAPSLPGAYDRLLDAPRAGRVSALFVGSHWVPRHVALVVEATARGTLRCTTPAYGRLDELDRFAFLGHRVDIAGWDVPWFVVTPDPRASAPAPSRSLGPRTYRRPMATMSMNKVIHVGVPPRPRPLPRRAEPVPATVTPPGPRRSARAWDNFDFQLTKHHEGEHEIAGRRSSRSA